MDDAKAFTVVFGGNHVSTGTTSKLIYNGSYNSTMGSGSSPITATLFYPPVACKLIAYSRVNQSTPAATTASVWIYRVVSLNSNLVVPLNSRAEIVTLATPISYNAVDYCDVFISSTGQLLAETDITLYFV